MRTFVLPFILSSLCSPAVAVPLAISDITQVDALGYTCIDGAYLEGDDTDEALLPFALTGKVRMPRTCLPEPCLRALTQDQLSHLTGTEMILPRFNEEWDDYYSRYADYCRKEVTPYGRTAATPSSPSDFWAPLLPAPGGSVYSSSNAPTGVGSVLGRSFVPVLVAGGGVRGSSGTSSTSGAATGSVKGSAVLPSSGSSGGGGGGTGGGGGGGGTPSPVPLPQSLPMLLAAVALAGVLLRRRNA